ncbi:lateral signaling target protein 2 homolog [Schistocerca americana]|uniref:lateral signaling target protein 2 homolog n=1 Tax=Schistocerca americana TaxID=7009 RepID=UPI001F4F83E0|nr:lateral signaling target protein 2 homolog [Schistocerca americana]
MESIRKWFYKPKKDDPSLLAQFFYADEALNVVAAELDSFDGRKDQERCLALVNHLRQCQHKVLTICNRIMDDVIPCDRANRDFRVKFPDDVMQENLAGQLWFGAECLAAGSSIMNRESESAAMRPLAKALTKALENVRNLLREQCLRGGTSGSGGEAFGERLQEALKIFDRLFAEFELCYVSALVPVKTPREYELQQLVVVLFSETLQRALNMKLLTQEMVDDYDPALMFTIPRLAIVSGLLIFPDGPLCLDKTPADMSEMFRPFRTLLYKIRELLWTLNKKELYTLEKLLCSAEEPSDFCTANGGQSLESQITPEELESNNLSDLPAKYPTVPDLDDFVKRFYIDYPSCKQFVSDFYSSTASGLNERLAASENCVVGNWENQDESEDDTEWVTESSEGETVVTEVCYGENGAVTQGETSGRMSASIANMAEHLNSVSDSSRQPKKHFQPVNGAPSDESDASTVCGALEQLTVVSTLPFPSSTLIASDFTVQDDDNLIFHSRHRSAETEESIKNTAKHLGHISACASTAEGRVGLSNSTSDRHRWALQRTGSMDDHQGSSASGSQEVLSPASVTVSRIHGEEEASTQSPIDSGVGTVVSCSDTGSLSDRSPDTPAAAEQRVQPEQESSEQQQWHLETIPCTCTLSSRTVLHSPQGVTQSAVDTNVDSVVNIKDAGELRIKILNIPANEHKINNVTESDILNNLDYQSTVRAATTCLSPSYNYVDNVPNAHATSEHLSESSTFHRHDRCVLRTVSDLQGASASTEDLSRNEDQDGREKWVGVATGDGQCSLCSGNEVRIQNQTRVLLLSSELDYAGNWDYLRRQNSSEVASSSGLKPEASSVPERKKATGTRWRGKRRGLSPGSQRVGKKEMSTPPMAVPIQSSRNLEVPVAGSYSSTCSSCPSSVTVSSDSCSMSSDTSSFNSECQDDEEIALAMQAAEIANRNEARAKFRSSEDLVHRLFVCIAGVADQLQTNFAGDLRNILKCVFLMSASQTTDSSESSDQDLQEQECPSPDENGVEHAEEAWESAVEAPPPWVPDIMAPRCMACAAAFTVVRRRHHCRNCGKVFCARCSSNSVPLPRYGHVKPVRVCNRCFVYQVTPFTLEESTPTRS